MHALSPTDSAFLWMETRNQPMHVAGLNLYTPPPGAGADFVSPSPDDVEPVAPATEEGEH